MCTITVGDVLTRHRPLRSLSHRLREAALCRALPGSRANLRTIRSALREQRHARLVPAPQTEKATLPELCSPRGGTVPPSPSSSLRRRSQRTPPFEHSPHTSFSLYCQRARLTDPAVGQYSCPTRSSVCLDQAGGVLRHRLAVPARVLNRDRENNAPAHRPASRCASPRIPLPGFRSSLPQPPALPNPWLGSTRWSKATRSAVSPRLGSA